MKKMSQKEAYNVDSLMPGNQNARVGGRQFVVEDKGVFAFVQSIPAGSADVVTPLALDDETGNRFDFEVLDVIVRTQTAVTSSTVQLKKGTNALTDAIVSAAANVITRAGQVISTYNKFYPDSDPAGYAAAPLNFVDAGGATAAARVVTVLVRRL